MSSPVEQIKERLPIADVVGGYVELQSAGKNLKACCPFHSERTPSFVVSPDRDTYYCFGCGAKGDIFSFVEAFEGLDFRGALQMLAERAGVTLQADDPARRDRRERLHALLEAATLFYIQCLADAPQAHAYLVEKRGVQANMLKHWRIGYAPADWHKTATHLAEKGFTAAEMHDAGITKERDGRTYDVFRGRIMFPIADAAGRTIAFSGRDLDGHGGNPENIPKYVNSPETELYTKSKVLYGAHLAKGPIRKHDFAIIAEGQLDVILSHQAGFANTVGLSGTALTHDQLVFLSRLSENIVFAFDTDAAGIAARNRSALRALALGMDVKVAALSQDIDPADLIKESGREAWRNAIRQSTHVVDVAFAQVQQETADDREMRKHTSSDVLPLIAAIPNRLDQSHFIKAIAGRLGVSEDILSSEMETVPAVGNETVPTYTAQTAERAPQPHRREQLKRLLLGIILWQETEQTPAIDSAHMRNRFAQTIGETELDSFATEMQSEYEDLRFQAEQHAGSVEDLSHYVDEILADIAAELLRQQYADTMEQLRTAEANGADSEKVQELRHQCQELIRALGRIRTHTT